MIAKLRFEVTMKTQLADCLCNKSACQKRPGHFLKCNNCKATSNGTKSRGVKSIMLPYKEGHERTEFHFLKPDYWRWRKAGGRLTAATRVEIERHSKLKSKGVIPLSWWLARAQHWPRWKAPVNALTSCTAIMLQWVTVYSEHTSSRLHYAQITWLCGGKAHRWRN